MIRYVLPVLLLLGLAVDASACNRCGFRGRLCRFQSHHVAHAPLAVAPTTTVFNFVNSFPAPFTLAPSGTSVYGVNQASAAYAQRPDYFMDRAVRLEELREVNSARGYADFQQSGRLSMSLNAAENLRANNTMLALAAMEKNTGSYQQAFSLTIQDGQPQPLRQVAGQPSGPQQLLQSQHCGSCHNGRGTKGAPKHVILDGSVEIDDATLTASFARIGDGSMPPGSKLTEAQKEVVRASLARMLARPQGFVEPPPPDPVPEPPVPMLPGNLE